MTVQRQTIVRIPAEQMQPADKLRMPGVEHGIRVITRRETGHDTSELQKNFDVEFDDTGRRRYAPMAVHKEKAATALSTGASYKLAAAYAGVSVRTIKNYQQSASFRQRVAELRESLMGQLQGRLVAEFLRRTEPDKIANLEIMDLVRLFDRAAGIGKANLSQKQLEDTTGADRYETIIEQILRIDTGGQSTDFPSFENGDFQLSAGSSPLGDEVPSS